MSNCLQRFNISNSVFLELFRRKTYIVNKWSQKAPKDRYKVREERTRGLAFREAIICFWNYCDEVNKR